MGCRRGPGGPRIQDKATRRKSAAWGEALQTFLCVSDLGGFGRHVYDRLRAFNADNLRSRRRSFSTWVKRPSLRANRR